MIDPLFRLYQSNYPIAGLSTIQLEELYNQLNWNNINYNTHNFTYFEMMMITLLYYRQHMTLATMAWIFNSNTSILSNIIDRTSIILEAILQNSISIPELSQRIGKDLASYLVVGAVTSICIIIMFI